MLTNYTRFIYFFILFFTGIIEVNSQSVGGNTSGGITSCDTTNTGFLSLTGYTGTIVEWESSVDSLVWNGTGNNLSVQSYYHVKQTTWYRAIVKNGAFPPDTSGISKIIIYPKSKGGIISGGGIFCGTSGAGTLSLSGYVDSILYWQYSTDNGNTWTKEANTTDTLNYSAFSQNRIYTAVVQTNVVCPVDTSSQASFVFSPSVGGTLSSGGVFCDSSGTGTLTLSGNIGAVLNWQYSVDSGATWTPVINDTSVLNYPNITQPTLYEAVVQLGACPPDSSTQATFSFNPTVVGLLTGQDSVCAGSNTGRIELSNHVGNVLFWLSSTDGGLTWASIPNTSNSLTYNSLVDSTSYKAVVQNETCRSDTSNLVSIIVYPLPSVYAGNDTLIEPKSFVLLKGAGEGTPLWQPNENLDSANIFTPSASPKISTNYILMVTDSNSCINRDSVYVGVKIAEFEGTISNLISANGDGINDVWVIEGIQDFPENEVFVFNIYGKQVFTKKTYENDWEATFNGAALPDGTYFYVLKLNSSGEIYKGSIDIVR